MISDTMICNESFELLAIDTNEFVSIHKDSRWVINADSSEDVILLDSVDNTSESTWISLCSSTFYDYFDKLMEVNNGK